MIISASRRTDIPAYYSEWFLNRIRDGFAYVRNPMNFHQISKISLSHEVVDAIVFWTKNPVPMMDKIDAFRDYPFYFQFTLTAYGKDIEPGLPSKNQVLIPAFCDLSKRIGRERVVWRYDPIFLNDTYTVDYHKKYFQVLAAKIGKYTEKCTVSFLDMYMNTEKNTAPLGIRVPTVEEQIELMKSFAETAKKYDFYIDTCAEKVDFSEFGIRHAHCVDRERIERIGNFHLDIKKDANQRESCGCVASIDIGTYNTCRNGCLYCYANYDKGSVEKQTRYHDPLSPLLFGRVCEHDVIKEKKMKTLIRSQLSLFD